MKIQSSMIALTLIVFLITSPFISAIYIQIDDTSTKPLNNSSQNQINQKISEIIQLINRTIIQQFFEELISIGPRMTSTYGCQKAGGYIFNTFRDIGLDANAYLWEGLGNKWHPGLYQSYNIEGVLHAEKPVNEEVIIFNAHYDTVEDTVGANDDGSGVVSVLAAAYALSHFTFNRTIKFVTFSGEEIGLLGSTAYVKQLYEKNEDILVELNADMIGKAETSEEGSSIRLSYSEDTEWIVDCINEIVETYDIINLNVTNTYPIDRDSEMGYSDYFPFIQYGYESIAFWEAAGDPNMHTPQDDLSNINVSYLVNTSRLIASTIAYVAEREERPLKMKIETPKKGKLYFKDRIFKSSQDEKTIVFDNLWVYLDIETFDAPIDKVEFYIDGKLEQTVYESPFVWNLNKISMRNHKMTVIAYDSKGRSSTDQISFYYWNVIRSN